MASLAALLSGAVFWRVAGMKFCCGQEPFAGRAPYPVLFLECRRAFLARVTSSLSGRSAAWLARLVRDQEVEGSNPFAPTTLKPCLTLV